MSAEWRIIKKAVPAGWGHDRELVTEHGRARLTHVNRDRWGGHSTRKRSRMWQVSIYEPGDEIPHSPRYCRRLEDAKQTAEDLLEILAEGGTL